MDETLETEKLQSELIIEYKFYSLNFDFYYERDDNEIQEFNLEGAQSIVKQKGKISRQTANDLFGS